MALQHNQLRVRVVEGCFRMVLIAPTGEGWLMGFVSHKSENLNPPQAKRP